jgi:two-component system phosphate regulon sensor histidine kinase PhoR
VETIDRTRRDARVVDQCLQALGHETERLTQVIERLLDWGRMEAGRKLFEMRPVFPARVADDAASEIAVIRLHRPDIDFAVEVEPNLPPIRAVGAAMVDAVVNLLSNAVKYGGVPPVVELRVRAGQGVVIFAVTDNGDGIPRAEHRRIFEKFYRIDDRLSREREGNGLGLAIVKHIVKAHRGRVELDSTLGRGSTFRIVVPALTHGSAPRPHRPTVVSGP